MLAVTVRRLIILTGLTVLGPEMLRLNVDNLPQYLAYLVLACLAAYFRVGVRSDLGHVPLTVLFVFLALMSFSFPAAILLATLATAIQEWVGREEPGGIEKVLFGASAMAVAVSMAQVAYIGTPGTQGLHLAARFVLTATVLFLGTSFPSAFMETAERGGSMSHLWKERYLWRLPYYLGMAVLAGLVTAASEIFRGWQIPFITFLAGYLVYRSYRLYMGRLEDGRRHAEEVASLHLRTIEALALAIDAKDESTNDHLQRVQIYAVEIAKELVLPEEQIEALRAASLLHDIGKLAVPEHIISKPGRLTPEEFEKMKIHPVVGAEILERVKFPHPVVPIVRSHHEKWDGTGYPDGLTGEEIPIGARILAAVDCLDALASDRHYRKAMPLDQAIGVVVRDAGTAFDPRVVEILARRYQELERLAKAQRSEPLKLTKDFRVLPGEAPAAGFVCEGAESASPTARIDFRQQIAAARQEAQALFELAQNLGSSLSLDETLSVAALRLKRVIPFDAMSVYLCKDDVLVPEFVSGENAKLFASLSIPIGQGLSGWVADTGRPILNGNPSVEPGYLNDPTKFSNLRSALAVPLDGFESVVGVLALYRVDRDAFSRDHLRILQAVSSKIALAVDNALRYKQAETSATTDFLTGLPNARSLFLQLETELLRAATSNQPMAVVVCDIDGFKQINDEMGHLEGNNALKAVAASLRRQCRETDYVARMGGDEFVLLLPGLTRSNSDARIVQIRKMVWDQTEAVLGCGLALSVGAAIFPTDGEDPEQLLALADRAMYASKARRSGIRIARPRPRVVEPGATMVG